MTQKKRSIIDDPSFRILFENAILILGQIYETVYCCSKLTNSEFVVDGFCNDPTCAIVGQNNDWCLVGGDVLILITWNNNIAKRVTHLRDVFDLKLINAYNVEILTDPWSDSSEIWHLSIDVNNCSEIAVTKIRDFKDYADKPYTDNVFW